MLIQRLVDELKITYYSYSISVMSFAKKFQENDTEFSTLSDYRENHSNLEVMKDLGPLKDYKLKRFFLAR